MNDKLQPMSLADMDALADLALRAAADPNFPSGLRTFYDRVASKTINHRVDMHRDQIAR